MKKIKSIYSEIVSKKNLYQAAYAAAKGRRYTKSVANFYFYLEEEVDRLHKELAAKTYRHGKYRVFTIFEPKKRNIAAAPFRDRVVHHAVNDVIEMVIDRSFIFDSYACRSGKGTHKAVDRAQKFLKANDFCLHCDVKKYFPSIDHGVLKGLLRKRIKDNDLLWLLDNIIDSAGQLTREKGRGLPIGNLTSQFFANLYLNELDHFIKFDLKCRYYLRYMDDILIFDNDKELLLKIKNRVRAFLDEKLKLALNEEKSQIYKTKGGLKFLGFRIFTAHRRIATGNVRRFKKRLKIFERLFADGNITAEEIKNSVQCWMAHSKYAHAGGLCLQIGEEFRYLVLCQENSFRINFC